MTEHKNPFDEENFLVGGLKGRLGGKVATILSARTTVDVLRRGDGSPVKSKDGKDAVRNCLEVVILADGEDKEWRETYSAGSLVPTEDGNGFEKLTPEGRTAGSFHASSEIAQLIKKLRLGGFDVNSLWDAGTGKQFFKRLGGNRFEFEAVELLDEKKQVKKSKDGKYTQYRYYPAKFVGKGAGASAGNGSVSAAIKEKATSTVVAALGANGGKATQIELIKSVNKLLAGDADAAAVVGLLVRPEFSTGAPWSREGTSFVLAS